MKLVKLECEHFAGVPDGSYAFGPLQRSGDDVRFVAGARGAGKTRLLEAVVALKELVGAYRAPPAFSSLIEPGAQKGRIGGTFVLNDAEIDETGVVGTAHDGRRRAVPWTSIAWIEW